MITKKEPRLLLSNVNKKQYRNYIETILKKFKRKSKHLTRKFRDHSNNKAILSNYNSNGLKRSRKTNKIRWTKLIKIIPNNNLEN